MANLLEGWDKIRRWIDNEPEDELPRQIRQAEANKSESERFLQKLLNEVENVLKKEIVRIPNTNKAYVPEKFVVYLSDETDKNLRRDKREFFERGLSVMIFERAKELAGKLELSAKKMNVQISVDPSLEEEIEVRAVSANEPVTVKTAEIPEITKVGGETIEDSGTIEDFDTIIGILYHVEIWQGEKKINEYPIIQRKNTIGRNDREKAANLRLPTNNRKISRLHAEIELDENGEVWVESLHKNPTIVSGQVIRNGERARLGEDGEIKIYDFTLKIKFAR